MTSRLRRFLREQHASQISWYDNVKEVVVASTNDISHAAEQEDAGMLTVSPVSSQLDFESPLDLPELKILRVNNFPRPITSILSRRSFQGLRWIVVSSSATAFSEFDGSDWDCTVERLYIRDQVVSKKGKSWIAKQGSIVSLAATNTNATDELISQLACKEVLRKLDVWGSCVQFSDTAAFSGVVFPSLRSLDMSSSSIGQSGLVDFGVTFPSLERLILRETNLSGNSLSALSSLPDLKVFDSGDARYDFDYQQDSFWDL